MTTTEKNVMIAEFMGLKIITDGISHFDTDFKGLKQYDKSWDCLMPVVAKIIEGGYSPEVHATDFDKTYNTVVKYIEYFNSKQRE